MILNYNKYVKVLENKNFYYQFPPKTENIIKAEGGLQNIKNWKVKILLGNSMSEKMKVGDFDECRYMAVSMVDNTIIPIAISDEHHRGEDLLYDYYQRKKLIQANDFHIVNTFGNHYIYTKKQIEYDYSAYTKLVKMGFNPKDLVIIFYGNEFEKNAQMSLSEFLKYKGNFNKLKKDSIKLGKISDNGLTLIKYLEELSILVKDYYLQDKDASIKVDIIDKCKEFYYFMFTYDIRYIFDIDYKIISNLKSNDVEVLKDALFLTGGIENTIHNKIRQNDKNAINFFHNLNAAMIEFDRITNI